MPESQVVLSYLAGMAALLAFAGLALFAVAHAKNRIIAGQREALAAEQRLRRAQEAFSANAHHELKTPLQIISGHLHILQQLDPRPEQAELLARAETATRRLRDLVQDLLDFTALQQGSLALRPEWMDLDPHLRALASEARARAEGCGLAFHLDAVPLPAPVRCDGARLRRALAALLDNALAFTSSGGLQVRWSWRTDAGRCLLRFEVEDTGPGVPADWSRLLAPFEQAVPLPGRVASGLGLGLPLASGLLGLMGGRLGLVPRSVGTLAWVEVPLERPDPA